MLNFNDIVCRYIFCLAVQEQKNREKGGCLTIQVFYFPKLYNPDCITVKWDNENKNRKISSTEWKRLSRASHCVTLSTSADQVWRLTQHSLRTTFSTRTYSMYEPCVADLDSHWTSFPGLLAVPPLRFSYTQDGWLDLKEIMGLHLVNPG